MRFAGVVGSDRPPPPSVDDWAALMPVPLLGLVPQPSVEEYGGGSHDGEVGTVDGLHVTVQRSVVISYTLLRYPQDKGDPRNLAELDDDLRRTLETPPSREMPEWVTEFRRRRRYPVLWEAVSTAWYSPQRRGAPPPLEEELCARVNGLLLSRYRDLRESDRLGRGPWRLKKGGGVERTHVEHGVAVEVNGVEVPGVRIDTSPHVSAVGADLDDRRLTAVVDRDALPFLRVAFADRPRAGTGGAAS